MPCQALFHHQQTMGLPSSTHSTHAPLSFLSLSTLQSVFLTRLLLARLGEDVSRVAVERAQLILGRLLGMGLRGSSALLVGVRLGLLLLTSGLALGLGGLAAGLGSGHFVCLWVGLFGLRGYAERTLDELLSRGGRRERWTGLCCRGLGANGEAYLVSGEMSVVSRQPRAPSSP